MELEYEESNHSSYYEVYGPSIEEQPAPEAPINVPIVILTPPINAIFLCCPGCEVLNKLVTELVLIEEDYPVVLSCNN